MCMSALGGALDAVRSAYQDLRPGIAEGRERQPDGLAVHTISARLVRLELIGKAQRRASGISSLGGVRLGIGR